MSLITNFNSFVEFYNYDLNSVIEIANYLISSEDFVTGEIRGDTLNVSWRIQLVNVAIVLHSFITMSKNAIQSKREIIIIIKTLK